MPIITIILDGARSDKGEYIVGSSYDVSKDTAARLVGTGKARVPNALEMEALRRRVVVDDPEQLPLVTDKIAKVKPPVTDTKLPE